MNQPLTYPLEQLMIIKKNRFDQAVKTLQQKKEILEKEYEKLYDITQERDEVKTHKGEWEKEVRYWSAQKEAVEQEELGSAAHVVRKKESEARKKKNHE